VELCAPSSGHDTAAQFEVQGAAAKAFVGEREAAMLDAIGALYDQGYGKRRGDAGAVTQDRGEVHVLAGAIDAALGVDIAIERAWCVAAFDAAIREIEGIGCEVEEGVLAGIVLGNDDCGLQAADAAGLARLEADVAVLVSRRRR